jgi:hypothetical protein
MSLQTVHHRQTITSRLVPALSAVLISILLPITATGATLRAEYRWNTNQAVNVSIRSDNGWHIDQLEDYNACGGESPTSDYWGGASITKTPPVSDGSVGINITIDPFNASPVGSFQAMPWPNRCEYASGYLPTTVTVSIYLGQ